MQPRRRKNNQFFDGQLKKQMHDCQAKRTQPMKSRAFSLTNGEKEGDFSSQEIKMPPSRAFSLTKKEKIRPGVTFRRFFGHTKRTPDILLKLFTGKLSSFFGNAPELHTVRASTPTS